MWVLWSSPHYVTRLALVPFVMTKEKHLLDLRYTVKGLFLSQLRLPVIVYKAQTNPIYAIQHTQLIQCQSGPSQPACLLVIQIFILHYVSMNEYVLNDITS